MSEENIIMLAESSLIAKIAELILPAVVADRIAKHTNRKKVAKLFKELHSILESLLDVCERIYESACTSEEESDPLWIFQEIGIQSKTIDSTSTRLIAVVHDLSDLIDIFDEKLLEQLNWIIAIKGSIIYDFPKMLTITYDGNTIQSITMQFPTEELASQILHRINTGSEYPDWPTSMIDMEVRESLKDVHVDDDNIIGQMQLFGMTYYADCSHREKLFFTKRYSPEDIKVAIDLKLFLGNHMVVIRESLAALKCFIRKHFSLEDMF